jgi:hypothetical protein
MRRLPIVLGALMAAVLLAALAAGGSRNAAAQASVPDLGQFGYPQVIGTVDYTPGQTSTVAAGDQQVILPADFISKTVKFELLQGDPSFFASSLPITDQGRTILVAFAFRVTDTSSNQLVARFDKPVQWSYTDSDVVAGSAVYNTSPANPPVVTPNANPGTITGTTIAHTFGGAGVGWLVLAPASAAAPTAAATQVAAPTEAPTSAPTEAPTVAAPSGGGAAETATPEAPVPVGMPSTGAPQDGAAVALRALLALAVAVVGGIMLRRSRVS